MAFTVRPATAADEPVLWQALFEAAHLGEEDHTALQAAQDHPDLARYLAGWPQPGDLGIVAELTGTNTPVGAAWLRLFSGDRRGYGWVDDRIPELAIGILPGYRGQGVGTGLLTHLLDQARAIYPGVSLSTRANNLAAVRLYERCGFREVADSQVVNRAGSISYNMRLDF